MMSKKSVYDKLVSRINGIDTKMSSSSALVIRTRSIIETNRVCRKRLRMLKERYPMLVDWSRGLIEKQKLLILKTRYLVLLLEWKAPF